VIRIYCFTSSVFVSTGVSFLTDAAVFFAKRALFASLLAFFLECLLAVSLRLCFLAIFLVLT
jgi:hypothetical protein